jgi:hypothetical protein
MGPVFRWSQTVVQLNAVIASGEVLPLPYLLQLMQSESQPLQVRMFLR